MIVGSITVTGVTSTSPGAWLSAMATLFSFAVMAARFLVPGLAFAPAPAVPLAILAMGVVGARRSWIDGTVIDGIRSPTSWIGVGLAIGAVLLVLSAPFTGVRESVAEPMLFPLREGRWLAVEGNGQLFNHHWPVAAQRGAWDLVRLGSIARSRRGFRRRGVAFYAFGSPVVAPCGGTVVRAVDGLPDGVPDTRRPAGNLVVIDTGAERVVLAHLRQGSVAVREGTTVSPGDPIGEVGDSGNSTEPHLHIHAQRDGRPLRLRFSDIRGPVGKGAVVGVRGGRRG